MIQFHPFPFQPQPELFGKRNSFLILGVNPRISQFRIGKSDDLTGITGIGEDFLIWLSLDNLNPRYARHFELLAHEEGFVAEVAV